MERTGNSHTESTDNTEILGFKFQDSSFRSRRKRRERRILLVDFPLRAVELNLQGSSHINHFKRCSGEQARNTVNGN